jgi:thiamine biosynthesis protein ThiS
MEIFINGDVRQVPEAQTVMDLLLSLQLDPSRVALELDGAILRQARWGETRLHPGAKLEIVHFVGGG